MSNSDAHIEHIAYLIRRSAAFPSMGENLVQSMAAAATWLAMSGGSSLFNQGDASEAMYIVVSGLLGVYVGGSGDEKDPERMIGSIGPGELVGEMGCIAGETRSATVRALRATELIAISSATLEELAREDPVILRTLSRTLVARLRRAQEGKSVAFRSRTYCLVPQSEDSSGARAFAADFTAALAALGTVYLATQDSCPDQTADSLSSIEVAHEYVVYFADAAMTSWSRLCLRQADTVLIVARGEDTPRPAASSIEPLNPGIPVDLVLLWHGPIAPNRTAAWLDVLHPRRQFHVRTPPDIDRAARLLTGLGLGLVFSGGGARGLAHIGVARALSERGIPIDAVCGTSIGSLIGALVALEWEFERMRACADSFSRRHPLRDLILPRVSLLSGRSVKTAFDDWFGDWAIEDTPIRYACVSANLNTGAASVHLRGKLKTWVRASTALPGVYPPVLEEGGVHIDGGIVNNLPADVVREQGIGLVVGVDVGSVALPTASPGIVEILVRAGTMNSTAQVLTRRQQCDLLLIPDVQHLSLMNWRAYDKAIEHGYRCALEKIDQIENRICEMRPPTRPAA